MIRLRRMVPADMRAVVRFCRLQNRRDKTSYGVPSVFTQDGLQRPCIALALVAVDDSGRIRGAYIFEWAVEMMAFGGNREVSAAAIQASPGVFYELRALGVEGLHIQVPKNHLGAVEAQVDFARQMGMTRDDDRLAHFYRDI